MGVLYHLSDTMADTSKTSSAAGESYLQLAIAQALFGSPGTASAVHA